ncbi:MAG: type II toxin-antitoxin system YafQ family toxin [Bacteroidota bacterium]|nr:type II toxin-antitoxin system mRNA interferase toxin, RelE/StbE family [Odoribacter sp.]MDP3643206.1 type II toxin-antitoxin system YafQ family toxin [Bacteroidota bacterium]
MFQIIFTNQFKKDYKLCEKRRYKIELLDALLIELAENGTLPAKYNPHFLTGNLSGFWEAHIKADWLLIWEKDVKEKTIRLIGTGTHSDLFK